MALAKGCPSQALSSLTEPTKHSKQGPFTWLMLAPIDRASCGTLRMRGTRYCATSSAGSARQLMKNLAVGVSAPACRAQCPFSELSIATRLQPGKIMPSYSLVCQKSNIMRNSEHGKHLPNTTWKGSHCRATLN